MTTLEFAAVRASVAQAVKQAEQARALRIESIDRQLPALEVDLATKQQEVAALRAERERLQAQTGHDLVAGMVGEGREEQDEPFLPGLPDKRLREVWTEWEIEGDEETIVFTRGDRYRWKHWADDEAHATSASAFDWDREAKLRPHGATWEHVKRLADAAEKKEAGPLKVGDRVEVPEGVRSVSGRQVDGGRYGVDRVFHDGDIGLNDGSIVRASDVRRV